MVGLFARMLPGGIVKETYQTLLNMPGVRDTLYDALKRERWGENELKDSPYDTLEKLREYEFFRVGLRELLTNVAKNDHTYKIAQNHHFEGIEEITLLGDPSYRRDTIFPYIFSSGSSTDIPPLTETMRQKIIYIINKTFGDEGYAEILLAKILHRGPYGGKQMHINAIPSKSRSTILDKYGEPIETKRKGTSFFRDEHGNITAKRIRDELLQRVDELINSTSISSSPHSTQQPQ